MISLFNKFLGSLDFNILMYMPSYKGNTFHYTALQNIESILLNQQEKMILWASQFDCLNDMSEGTVVEKCYQQVCKELKDEGYISDGPKGLYSLLSDVKPSRNKLFLINENGTVKPHRGEYTTYILSFSKSSDLLPMWNYYSKGAMFEGISLGIDSKTAVSSIRNKFSNGGIETFVSPVIYNEMEQKEIIRTFLLEIIRKFHEGYEACARAIVSMKLTSWKMLFKQECFSHEQEVRLIVDVAEKYRDVLPVKYRTSSGYIVPYIELGLDKKALKSVTLGPFRGNNLQMDIQKRTLNKMLASHNYDAEIEVSDIPVRY